MIEKQQEESDDETRARYKAEFLAEVGKAETPDNRALDIMSEIEELWLAVAPGKTAEDFEHEIHNFFDTQYPDLDEMEEEYADISDVSGEALGDWPLIDLPIRIAYGHAYAARLWAIDSEGNPMAWNAIESASFFQGVALGLVRLAARTGSAVPSIKDNARKAAHARNAENRAIKADAFEWLDANFDPRKSMDSTAKDLEKVVPVVFRTARRYVKQWSLSRQ